MEPDGRPGNRLTVQVRAGNRSPFVPPGVNVFRAFSDRSDNAVPRGGAQPARVSPLRRRARILSSVLVRLVLAVMTLGGLLQAVDSILEHLQRLVP
jgi:hypothetical protein